jgi:hypothetical protein
MSTSIEIWNMAMMKIGADRITAFGVDSEAQMEAALGDTIYATEKRSMLRLYPWNCAIKRAALAELATAPPNQYAHAYALPSDYIRLLELRTGDMALTNINGEGVRSYVVEGKAVLTNQANIIARYVADIDESLFDAHLEEALIAKLSFESVYAIGQSATALSNFGSIYEGKVNEARTVDALENPHVVLRTDTLRVVRH